MTHSPSSAQSNEMKLSITPTQIQALYLLLLRRHRPEFGWMEEPLVAIEAALKPAHDAIHDRSFNAMNRQFFGDDRFHLDEAPMPAQLEAHAAASAHTIGEDAANGAMGERANLETLTKLRTFLDTAAGEGFVLGGVDAADLFMDIFDGDDKVSDRMFSDEMREDAANVAMGEREAFEAWARTDEGNCADYDLARKTAPWTDEYRNDLVQRDWEVWQARAALTAEKVAGQEPVKDAAPAQSTENDAAEQFENLDLQNHRYRNALRKIMARLTDLLDEDQFGNIESIVREVGVEPATIPANVMSALDRMCTPLDESVLKGATAEADAHSMKLIRDYVLYTAPQPSQPAQSGEHCVNCGASVDPLCACERGRKLAAQSAEQDERAAHCVNTCNFYNKNRPCECPAPQSDAAAWEAIFDRVALELNCLPSSSPDGNEHVFHAIAKLRAASTQSTATQPVQTERALTDEQREAIEYAANLIDEKWGERMKASNTLRALLAAQPASSLAEGGERE